MGGGTSNSNKLPDFVVPVKFTKKGQEKKVDMPKKREMGKPRVVSLRRER